MNFFEHQQLARRNTRVMVALFALAVVAIVVAVDLAILLVYNQAALGVLVAGAVAVTAMILVVSVLRIRSLAAGGAAVAAMAGARQVAADTRDALERRLLNVVEEMAIASGVRVPAVYVMDDEPGINAFAAGWEVSSAALAVTRGALQVLTRDELQGVVAHEFSHILNGDMRLNIRMLGVLAGIVALAVSGRILMSGRKSGRLAAAGLAVFATGYIGLFFARLIKASVSRQREFLADASGVQFTRNPQGIAGALDQMRASAAGALITGRHAEDLVDSQMNREESARTGKSVGNPPYIYESVEAAMEKHKFSNPPRFSWDRKRAEQSLVKVEKGLMLKRDPDGANRQPIGEGAALPRRPVREMWEELAMVKVPMVVVRGNRSSRYPAATVERLTKNYPHIPQMVTDSEHDVAGQAPEALIKYVRTFIAGA